MTMPFPPQPAHPAEVEKLAKTFAAVVEGHDAVYVSSPLTTGESYIEWRSTSSAPDVGDAMYAEAFSRAVVEPNRERAREYVARLRGERAEVVIDPTALPDLAGWSQEDYRSLWGEVIARYVRLLVLRNGWEHSDGCTYEFVVAIQSGIPIEHEDVSPMTREEGIELIRASVAQRQAIGISVEFALAALDALPGDRASSVGP